MNNNTIESIPTHLDEKLTREILPQQPPFVMIDSLTSCTEETATTSFLVREDNIFLEDGRMLASGMAENIAQSCSARLGFINKYIKKRDMQIGVIGSIRDMKVADTPRVGDELHTTVHVLQDIMGVLLIEGSIECGGNIIASAQMKIAEV